MNRLIWKGFKETWLIGSLLPICVVLSVVYSGGYPFIGVWQYSNTWVLLPVIVSLLLGLGTSQDISSKPYVSYISIVPIKVYKIVAAQVTTAFMYAAISAAIGATVFLLVCPDEYRHLVAASRVVYGFSLCIGLSMFGWYLGYCISSLSNSFYSKLVVLMWSFLAMLIVYVTSVNRMPLLDSWLSYTQLRILALIPMVVMLINIVIRRRVSVIVWILCLVIAVAAIWRMSSLAYQRQSIQVSFTVPNVTQGLSPTGQYLARPFVTRELGAPFGHSYIVIYDLINKKCIKRIDTIDAYSRIVWVTPNILTLAGYTGDQPSLMIMDIQDDNRIMTKSLSLDERDSIVVGSSNGYYATVIYGNIGSLDDSNNGLFREYIIRRPSEPPLFFRILDVRNAKWLSKPIQVSYCWWQNANSVGYVDTAGKRQILQLSGGNR